MYLQTYCGKSNYSHKDWEDAMPAILKADTLMRRKISNELMDAVCAAIRHGTAEPYTPLLQRMHHFTASVILNDIPLQRDNLRLLLLEVEDPLKAATLYKPYRDSTAYKANHYEHRRNRQEEAGFVFGR